MTHALSESIFGPPTPGLACWVHDLRTEDFSAIGWSDLLGLSDEPTSLNGWLQVVHDEERDQVRAIIEEQIGSTSVKTEAAGNCATKSGPDSLGFQMEYRAATAGGFRWMFLRGQRVCDKDGVPVRMIVTSFDATMIRSLQQELLGVEPTQSIAKAAPILIWTTNPKGRCEWFNQRWLDFTGHTLESALVAGRCGNAHPSDREPAMSAFRAAFEQRDSIELEYRLRHHDGTYRWVLDRSSPRFEESGEFAGYVGVCLDITHEYEYRQRLCEREQMLASLHDINDRERMFLSCAIHDGILQDIIGADMLLQDAERLEPETLEDRLKLAHSTLRSAIRHGRRLISELRPMILDEQGLVSAIEYYAAELENRGSVKINVVDEFGDEELCPFWSGNVFRIVQSAMNNVELHSDSKNAVIHISLKPDRQLCVVVTDYGIGFDLNGTQDSFGLRCMRERAELFGGSLEVESSHGKGTVVKILVPIREVRQ